MHTSKKKFVEPPNVGPRINLIRPSLLKSKIYQNLIWISLQDDLNLTQRWKGAWHHFRYNTNIKKISRKNIYVEKTRWNKTLVCLDRKQLGPAKAACMCLILKDCVILMRHKKIRFQKLDFAQHLSCFSSKTSKQSEKFWDNHLSQLNNISIVKKNQRLPLLQEPLSQPVLSVELFISDLIV